MKYTIGITTFASRFEIFFKPLLNQIKKNLPDVEVIVYINGEVDEFFNEEYRKNILMYLSEQYNVYPIMSPYFRSLAKLWNSLIVQSSNDMIFIFNDDIWLEDQFFSAIPEIFKMCQTSFRLNGSFSHFCVNRQDAFEMGFFDERLIGLGEEDGDWCFRWEKFYQKHLPSLHVNNLIKRYDGYSSKLKETPWNSDWIFKNKYDADNEALGISQGFPANGAGGMYGKPVALRTDYKELDLYPAEEFFWKHISELNKNFGKRI
jgi:hypothetical protein